MHAVTTPALVKAGVLPGPLAPTSSAHGGWSALARAVCATSWLLAGAAVVLQLVHRETPANLAYWLMDTVSAVVYGAVTVAMLPRTRHVVSWIIVAVALGCAASALATQYTLWWSSGADLPAVGAVLPLSGWTWVPGTYATMAVMPFVVTDRALSRWVRAVLVSAVAAIALSVLLPMVYPYHGVPPNPLAAPDAVWDVLEPLFLWPDRWCVVLAFVGLAHLAWRWRREPVSRRRGLGWLLVGQSFLAVAFVPVVVDLPARFTQPAVEFSGVTLLIAQAFLPAALLVVVLGHRLWGVDVLVSRATTWWLLTGLVVATYVGVAWLAGRLVPGSEEVAAAVAVGTVAVMGYPLRVRVQHQVDRLVYGPAVDPSDLLRSIGSSVREPMSHEEMVAELAESLRRSYRLGWAEVHDADDIVVARTSGAAGAGGSRHEVPLVVGQQRIGTLAVAARPGERLDQRTTAALGEVSHLVAVALGLARANAALQAARDRLLAVRQEERRLLRRDLHDGLGPALAGVSLGLAAAQRKAAHDPEGAVRLLAELEAEVQRRTLDLRQISRSLLPPELDDGDLPGALAALAARFADTGLRVHVDVDPNLGLDTRQQVAIYHVAAEAVLNAHRHADAREVRIRVRRDGSGVLTEISDDGCGLPSDRVPGVGTRSMRERAEELGGSLTLADSRPVPGTTVRMRLP